MANSSESIVREVQRILQEGGDIPQRVQNRMLFAAILELNKEVQHIKSRVDDVVRYPSLLWFLVKRPQPTIGAILLVFALLSLIFSSEARDFILGLL